MDVIISPDGFINALRALNGGAVVEELDRELMKGVQAIMDHGGSSEVTLKFKMKRIPNLETAINIAHDVIAKHPREERPDKAMFVTAGSGLTDQYQDQGKLPLGAPAPAARPTLASINKQTGEISNDK